MNLPVKVVSCSPSTLPSPLSFYSSPAPLQGFTPPAKLCDMDPLASPQDSRSLTPPRPVCLSALTWLCRGPPSLRLHRAPSFRWLHLSLASHCFSCRLPGLLQHLSLPPLQLHRFSSTGILLPPGFALVVPPTGVTSFCQAPFFALFPRARDINLDLQTCDVVLAASQ